MFARKKASEPVFLGGEAIAGPAMVKDGWQDGFIRAVGGKRKGARWTATIAAAAAVAAVMAVTAPNAWVLLSPLIGR